MTVLVLIWMMYILVDFTAKLGVSSKRGSPEDTAIKDESRIPLVAILQKLGYYVNMVADGQFSVLLSSDYPVNSTAKGSKAP